VQQRNIRTHQASTTTMLSSPQSTTQTNTVIAGNVSNNAVVEKDIVLQGKYLFDSFEFTYQLDF
jgi:hypothetical protein